MPSKLEQALKVQGIYFDVTQTSEPETFFWNAFLTVIAGDLRRLKNGAALRGIDLPTPSVAFTTDLDVNAFADKIEDEYCIIINIGTVLVLQDVFNKIFSSKEAFPQYGDPSGERGAEVGINPHIWDATTILTNPTAGGSMPVDPIRATAAALLTMLAIRFLALHEFGHIVNGHVDYRYSLGLGFRLNEVPRPEAASAFSPLDSQTLEMDADAFATQFGLHSVLQAQTYGGKIFDLLARDKKEAVNLWHTAAHVFFRLFANARLESETLSENTYPTFGARIIGHRSLIAELLLNQVSPALRQELGIEGVSVVDVCQMSMAHFQSVERAFHEMHPAEYAAHALDMYEAQIAEPEKQASAERLRHWGVLRPKLMRYAFGSETLAPVQG